MRPLAKGGKMRRPLSRPARREIRRIRQNLGHAGRIIGELVEQQVFAIILVALESGLIKSVRRMTPNHPADLRIVDWENKRHWIEVKSSRIGRIVYRNGGRTVPVIIGSLRWPTLAAYELEAQFPFLYGLSELWERRMN